MPDPLMDRIAFIDRSILTIRDVRILDCIMNNPGLNGSDIVTKLKLRGYSSVAANFARMLRHEMIVDRRHGIKQAIPSRFYVTDKGARYMERVRNG